MLFAIVSTAEHLHQKRSLANCLQVAERLAKCSVTFKLICNAAGLNGI